MLESPSMNVGGKGLTVAAWVRPIVATLSGGVLEKTIAGVVNTQFLLFLENGVPKFRVCNNPAALGTSVSGSNQFTAIGNATMSAGQWSRLVGTYDGRTVQLYCDGVLQAVTPAATFAITPSTGATTGNVTTIGTLGGIYPFNGQLDLPSVHNVAWTPAQVAADLIDPIAPYRPGSHEPLWLVGAPPYIHAFAGRSVFGLPFCTVG